MRKKHLEKKSHNRGSPQQLACYWIRSKKFLTIGYQASNQRLTLLKMAIEIVDFSIKHGGSFHRYVKLPEGKTYKNTVMREWVMSVCVCVIVCVCCGPCSKPTWQRLEIVIRAINIPWLIGYWLKSSAIWLLGTIITYYNPLREN